MTVANSISRPWVAPADVTRAHVRMWGGGGGGGCAGAGEAAGGGGSGAPGGYEDAVISVVPGHTYTLIGGLPGRACNGSNPATAGGASEVVDQDTGQVVIATGGGGGGGNGADCEPPSETASFSCPDSGGTAGTAAAFTTGYDTTVMPRPGNGGAAGACTYRPADAYSPSTFRCSGGRGGTRVSAPFSATYDNYEDFNESMYNAFAVGGRGAGVDLAANTGYPLSPLDGGRGYLELTW